MSTVIAVICPHCGNEGVLPKPGVAWQPIETAPKDGTRILVVRAGEDEIEITEWCVFKREHYEAVGNGLYRKVMDDPYGFWNGNGHRATHWMPLPDPPGKQS